MVSSMAFALTSAFPRLAVRAPTPNVLRLSSRLSTYPTPAHAAASLARKPPSMVSSPTPHPSPGPAGPAFGARRSTPDEFLSSSTPPLSRGAGGPPPPPGGGGRGGGGGGGGGGGEGADESFSAAAGGGGAGLGALLLRSWTSYLKALDVAPIKTKAITAGVLVGLGDTLAQMLTGTPLGNLDLPRLFRFAAFGLVLQGPVGHAWYNLLERVVRLPGVAGIAGKVAADQLLFAPVFTSIFFGYLCVTEGGQLGDVREAVTSKLPSTLIASWKVWPLAHIINFGVIPLGLRVLYVNAVSTAWIAFLSMTASKASAAKS
ncbi:hypothetical protein I4F81_000317 [Pyropia yezoensis]|uniref:Uncharacterized protein n=2 Tax=Pyropia yezoensis TaxID=2788 RepID=A0ACC3BIE1_PYRYE|nr:MPV17 [Neopyropia yezoensis]KAK1857702.1 hypothetical protein I4F81_000317 [Neopyropia yezoensis]